MFRHRIVPVLLLCLILINGIYAGSTMSYVYSLSGTCVNTFTGESNIETTTETSNEITTESSTENNEYIKSPDTGNNSYMFTAALISLLISIFILGFYYKKIRRKQWRKQILKKDEY